MAGTTAASQYDQLLITGHARLGGTLELGLLDGFSPSPGQSFNIPDWSGMNGNFPPLILPALAGSL